MNAFYTNLNKKTSTNYLRLILGILMIGATVYIQFFSSITRFQPYQLILLFLFGVYYAIMGAGMNLINLIAKSFINISNDAMVVKQSIFKGKTVISWNDISEIQINITAIRIKRTDKTEFQFEYQQLEDEVIHTLKTAIAHQAKLNDISIS
ncbi:hypothetical protein [Carboxylicivirga marina]|uniref:hypothetical protein n=1 Tax=Carboxylicivirga marina TaxID=2800988 RepID=UPI00259ADBAF|nr:hypothetical protein [uncultured Carboxylicivirga sp.]